MMRRTLVALLLLGAGLAAAPVCHAADLYGLTDDGRIIRFDPASPGTLELDRPVSGLLPGQRPTALANPDGLLTVLTGGGGLARLDPTTAAVEEHLGIPFPRLAGDRASLDGLRTYNSVFALTPDGRAAATEPGWYGSSEP